MTQSGLQLKAEKAPQIKCRSFYTSC